MPKTPAPSAPERSFPPRVWIDVDCPIKMVSGSQVFVCVDHAAKDCTHQYLSLEEAEHLAQEREAAARAEFDKEFFLNVIDEWTSFWMNQKQNCQQDYENYFRRALGVDANMRHHLADLLSKAARSKAQEGK